MQTVFEGFGTNNADAAKATADKFDLEIPVGHDPGTDGKRSNVLTRYKTQGTPWMIVIDPQGVVRANGFVLEHDATVTLIDKLAKDAADGAGLLKQPFPGFGDDATWLDKKSKDHGFAKFKLTAVRYWCVDSESDTATLKAIIKLYKKYLSKNLNLIVAVRAAKPGEPIDAAKVAARAKKLKWKGPLVIDPTGAALEALQQQGYPKDVESPTLLLDWEGNVVWVATTDKMVAKDKQDPAAVEAHDKLAALLKKRLTGK